MVATCQMISDMSQYI